MPVDNIENAVINLHDRITAIEEYVYDQQFSENGVKKRLDGSQLAIAALYKEVRSLEIGKLLAELEKLTADAPK